MAENHSGGGVWRLNPSHIAEALIIALLIWVASNLSQMHDDIINMKKDINTTNLAMSPMASQIKTLQDGHDDHERRIYRLEYAVLPEVRGQRK